MRALVRELCVWLIGYPLSVLAASMTLASVHVIEIVGVGWHTPQAAAALANTDMSLRGLLAVVGLVGLPPALVTHYGTRTTRFTDYVYSGAWSGFAVGVFATFFFTPLLVVGGTHIIIELAAGRAIEERAIASVLWLGAAIAIALSLFMVAGSAGGSVFGAVATALGSTQGARDRER